MPTEQEVRAIKQRHSAELRALPGVCGVGIEKDDEHGYVLVIHVDASRREAGVELPLNIEGCPVRLVSSGPFSKS